MQETYEGVPQPYYGEAPPPTYDEASPPNYEVSPPPIHARAVDLTVSSYEREVPNRGYSQPSAPHAYAQPAGRPVVIAEPSAPYAYAQPAGRRVVTEETRTFQTETGCVGGILVVSCVELAEAAIYCDDNPWDECEDRDGYAVAVGVISLVVCLYWCALRYFKVPTIKKYNKTLSIFLMLWWGVATALLTFDSPFMWTGNGYFACWGATLLSIYYCQITVSRFKMLGERISQVIVGDRKEKVLMLILLFSIVEAAAAVILWDEHDCYWCRGEKQTQQETWAFCAGFISGSAAALYFLKAIFDPGSSGQQDFLKYLSWFLAPWWLFGAGVATFDEPFPDTGNGYFCAWGALICSCYLVYLTTVVTGESV